MASVHLEINLMIFVQLGCRNVLGADLTRVFFQGGDLTRAFYFGGADLAKGQFFYDSYYMNSNL